MVLSFRLAALLTGGMVLGGAVVGGIIGSLFLIGTEDVDEDRERLNKELTMAKAAVGIMTGADAVADDRPPSWPSWAAEPETFELSDEAVADAEEVAAARRKKTLLKKRMLSLQLTKKTNLPVGDLREHTSQ